MNIKIAFPQLSISMARLVASASLLCVLVAPSLNAEEKQAEKKITFDDHIKPIFREHCTACHSESDKSSDLALDTYAATLAGGSSGEVIAEGDSDGSRLFALVVHAEQPYMPPDQDPIAKEQIELLKTWIEQGMPENSGSKIKRTNAAAAAMLSNVSAGKPEGPPPMPETILREPVVETERSAAIAAMAASPWAPLIAVGGQEQVSLYHSETGKLLGILPFPEGEPQSLTFTRDGKQLLIGGGEHSKNGCAVLVDIASGERLCKVGDELDIVLASDISPDKRRIALAGPQKIVRIYDSLSGDLVTEMKKHTDWIFSLRYSPDGILLATGDRSNGLIVWEADSGNLYAQLNGHRGAIRALDFRADSNVLASASLDGTVKLWDMLEAKQIKSWNAHGGGVTAVNFANNGMLATCGRDSRAKIWDGNGGLKKEFKGLSEAALEIAFTGDGQRLAAGDWNGTVQLWPASDPNLNIAISANPPSIAKRLTAANTTLQQVQTQFDQLATVATTATSDLQAEQAKLTAAQSNAQMLAEKLGTTKSQQQQLNQQVGSLNAKIQELQAQLDAAKTEKQSVTQKLTQTQKTVQELAANEQQAKTAVAAHQAAMQKLTEAADKAKADRDAVASKLAAAKSAAQEAAEDQAKLLKQAEALRMAATTTTQAVDKISAEMKAVAESAAQQQSQTEAINQKMTALQAQLADLQKQAEEIAAAQAKAQQELAAKLSTEEQLKQQLETSQQAALDAKEKLELFEKSYQKDDSK